MYGLGKSYDWHEELFQPPPTQGHNLSLSGGNEKNQYFLSANVLQQEGLVINSGYKNYSIRANISGQVKNWFKIGTTTFAFKSRQNKIPGSVFSAAYQISPLGKMYEDEENPSEPHYTLYPMSPDMYIANPFTELEIRDQIDNMRIMNSTYFEFSFLKGFKY